MVPMKIIEDKILQIIPNTYNGNPLPSMSDQDRISPYNIYMKLCRQVMRIRKNINYKITK